MIVKQFVSNDFKLRVRLLSWLPLILILFLSMNDLHVAKLTENMPFRAINFLEFYSKYSYKLYIY